MMSEKQKEKEEGIFKVRLEPRERLREKENI